VAIATGNWGCGAFGGNPYLKSLIQLMAAAECGRDVAYFTFGDEQLRNSLFDMHTFLRERKVTVGQLYQIICAYKRNMSQDYDLHTHIHASLLYDEDTEDEDVPMEVDNASSTNGPSDEPPKVAFQVTESTSAHLEDERLVLTLSSKAERGGLGGENEETEKQEDSPTSNRRKSALEKMEQTVISKGSEKSKITKTFNQLKMTNFLEKK
jgi:hypothetical protein